MGKGYDAAVLTAVGLDQQQRYFAVEIGYTTPLRITNYDRQIQIYQYHEEIITDVDLAYDFEADTIGSVPSGFSFLFGSATGTGNVIAGKYWTIDPPAPGGKYYINDDTGSLTDCIVTGSFYRNTSVAETRIYVRHTGDAEHDGYLITVTASGIQMDKFVNGSYIGSMGTASKTFNAITWYNFRVEATGTTIRAWAGSGSWPGTWDISATDSTHSSGYVLFGNSSVSSSSTSFDNISISYQTIEEAGTGNVPYYPWSMDILEPPVQSGGSQGATLVLSNGDLTGVGTLTGRVAEIDIAQDSRGKTMKVYECTTTATGRVDTLVFDGFVDEFSAADDTGVARITGVPQETHGSRPGSNYCMSICRWRKFGGDDCQYVGESTSCGRTLADCQQKISYPTISGSGLDDMTTKGTHTGTTIAQYRVQIDATGTPDTFSWSNTGDTNWDATGVAITGSSQTLENGVSVAFGATTGHTLGNYWTFQASWEDYFGNLLHAPAAGTVISLNGTNVQVRQSGPGYDSNDPRFQWAPPGEPGDGPYIPRPPSNPGGTGSVVS